MDEPCLRLTEVDLVKNGKRRRYRVFFVVRGEHIAEHLMDLGPSENFKDVDQAQVIGGVTVNGKLYIEHTVGELVDIIHALRLHKLDKSELVG